MKKFIVPLVAGAVAATLMTTPALAGGAGNDRSDRAGASQAWEQQGFKSRKAKRRAARAENRRANRQGIISQKRKNRKARRSNGGGGIASAGLGGGGHQGSITELLNQGGPLPEYLGGFNQPKANGSGSITQSLGGYDLPDYIGGYNQAPDNGAGSILDAIGDVNIYQ